MNTFLRHAILLFILIPMFGMTKLFAERGDTTKVKLFDKYLWTWYGNQNRWGEFPSQDKRFERIFMNFTLTCPKGGCGEWDYTMRVYARTKTGKMDSNLVDAPMFSKAGAFSDSVRVALLPTFKTKYVQKPSKKYKKF